MSRGALEDGTGREMLVSAAYGVEGVVVDVVNQREVGCGLRKGVFEALKKGETFEKLYAGILPGSTCARDEPRFTSPTVFSGLVVVISSWKRDR